MSDRTNSILKQPNDGSSSSLETPKNTIKRRVSFSTKRVVQHFDKTDITIRFDTVTEEVIDRSGSSGSLNSTTTPMSTSRPSSVCMTPVTPVPEGLNTTFDVFGMSPGNISIASNRTVRTPAMNMTRNVFAPFDASTPRIEILNDSETNDDMEISFARTPIRPSAGKSNVEVVNKSLVNMSVTSPEDLTPIKGKNIMMEESNYSVSREASNTHQSITNSVKSSNSYRILSNSYIYRNSPVHVSGESDNGSQDRLNNVTPFRRRSSSSGRPSRNNSLRRSLLKNMSFSVEGVPTTPGREDLSNAFDVDDINGSNCSQSFIKLASPARTCEIPPFTPVSPVTNDFVNDNSLANASSLEASVKRKEMEVDMTHASSPDSAQRFLNDSYDFVYEDVLNVNSSTDDTFKNSNDLKDTSTNSTALKDKSINSTALKDKSINSTALEDKYANSTALKDTSTNSTTLKDTSTNSAALEDKSANSTASRDATQNLTTSNDKSQTSFNDSKNVSTFKDATLPGSFCEKSFSALDGDSSSLSVKCSENVALQEDQSQTLERVTNIHFDKSGYSRDVTIVEKHCETLHPIIEEEETQLFDKTVNIDEVMARSEELKNAYTNQLNMLESTDTTSKDNESDIFNETSGFSTDADTSIWNRSDSISRTNMVDDNKNERPATPLLNEDMETDGPNNFSTMDVTMRTIGESFINSDLYDATRMAEGLDFVNPISSIVYNDNYKECDEIYQLRLAVAFIQSILYNYSLTQPMLKDFVHGFEKSAELKNFMIKTETPLDLDDLYDKVLDFKDIGGIIDDFRQINFDVYKTAADQLEVFFDTIYEIYFLLLDHLSVLQQKQIEHNDKVCYECFKIFNEIGSAKKLDDEERKSLSDLLNYIVPKFNF
uniref:Spc7 domain-containing protein n=1 Tax=Strongyloides venezuelensis TaxID=75913 RepID=A0A0K0G3N9_STRVS